VWSSVSPTKVPTCPTRGRSAPSAGSVGALVTTGEYLEQLYAEQLRDATGDAWIANWRRVWVTTQLRTLYARLVRFERELGRSLDVHDTRTTITLALQRLDILREPPS
jgi:hypothetical protein